MKKIILTLSLSLLLASCGLSANNPSTQTGTTETNNTAQETKNAAQETKNTNTTNDNTANVPTYGTGASVIEVFADFQCPACQNADKSISPILEKMADEGKITIAYRQFPLSFHANAFGDALAAMCSADQGKYQEYKKALYALEAKKGNLPVSNDERATLAEMLGLDKASFTECITSQKYASHINSDIKRGTNLGVNGTPTYVQDGKILSLAGIATGADLEKLIEGNIAK